MTSSIFEYLATNHFVPIFEKSDERDQNLDNILEADPKTGIDYTNEMELYQVETFEVYYESPFVLSNKQHA